MQEWPWEEINICRQLPGMFFNYFMHNLSVLMHKCLFTKTRMLNLRRNTIKTASLFRFLLAMTVSYLRASCETHSFNCSAVRLPWKEMKCSIVSTEVDMFCPSVTTVNVFLSHTRSFILWKSHTYTETQTIRRKNAVKTSCSSHAACLLMHPKILSNSLSGNKVASAIWPEFPSFILWEEENC